ncbi:WD40 repeat domain-containing protein [Spirulina subsalsa]|uniref:WD40 repeat domain-containing protein n=1 Tax=Spirulina subsalsa TaxID=54311 RepID=UPI0002FF3A09|nr:WD40 repeat domain-containing protein [Spirulina subsalsa]
MSESTVPDLTAENNQRSLSTLLRAIAFSQEQFTLILLRCNYQSLQQEMWEQLQGMIPEADPLYLYPIYLPPRLNTLFTTLHEVYEQEFSGFSPELLPGALSVFNLDGVADLESVLEVTNQMRDEFRKSLPLPILLWVTDEVLQKLTRLAPDFKSWAATSLKFELAPEDAIVLWWQTTDSLFQQLLEAGVEHFLPNEAVDLAPGCRTRQELEFAKGKVETSQNQLNPVSEATWLFILGRDAYGNQQIDQALEYFQASLKFWSQGKRYPQREQAGGSQREERLSHSETLRERVNPFLNHKGLVLFHLGLCYCRQAQQKPVNSRTYWLEAKYCFSASLEIFRLKNLQDPLYTPLVNQMTVQVGRVLQKLEDWHALQRLSLDALKQTTALNDPGHSARVYGFLTQVALASPGAKVGERAEQLARQAIALQEQAPNAQATAHYLLLLAQAQMQQGQVDLAQTALEQAKETLIHHWSEGNQYRLESKEKERLYLTILEQLRSLYFQKKQYQKAFTLKQEKHFVEQYSGLRAFHGVPTSHSDRWVASWSDLVNQRSQHLITASGRQTLINDLLERMSRHDHKLTILHGFSGVGKSTLLRGGLIPQLRGQIISAREVLPVLQSRYRDWEAELTLAYQEAHKTFQDTALEANQQAIPPWQPEQRLQDLLTHLHQNAQGQILTVLMFDQFEEFFFLTPDHSQRQKFYEFLRDTLQLPFVKIILSLREDYLHYLLNIERSVDLEAINNNLLDRQIRYQLGDLSPDYAHQVISQLTEAAQFHLEPRLIEAFVSDLAQPRGTVRPIELHLVGAQLQAEQITTFDQYQNLGKQPKATLVTRSLLTIIDDCGLENRQVVWQILFTLTASNGTRTLKTKSELSQYLKEHQAAPDPTQSVRQWWPFKPNPLFPLPPDTQDSLDLILEILVGSRLVVRFPEDPEDRYQLVHDYLVGPIREQYSQVQVEAIEAQFAQKQQALVKVEKQRLKAIVGGGVMGVLALAAGYWAWQANLGQRLAQNASLNAELLALSTSSEALFISEQRFDALLEALRAAKALQEDVLERHRAPQWPFLPSRASIPPFQRGARGDNIPPFPRATIIPPFQRGARGDNIPPFQRATIIPPFQREARGDNPTAQLGGRIAQDQITPDPAHLLKTFPLPSQAEITPATQFKVIAALEQAIYGVQEKNRFSGHEDVAWSVQFIAQDQIIASTSRDGLIKLWRPDGQLLANLRGHEQSVTSVDWSQTPQDALLASSSEDGTVKLWSMTLNQEPGTRNREQGGRERQLSCLQPVGCHFAPPQTIAAQQGIVYTVRFTPDGQRLITGGEDGTVKLWTRWGELQGILTRHPDAVRWVAVHPQGNLIASASRDGTIRLVSLTGEVVQTLTGHSGPVSYVAFSPDGQGLASAGDDKTIRLWEVGTGELQQTLTEHQDWVFAVNFSPDGQGLVSGSKDGRILVWNRQGEVLQTLLGHRDGVTAVQFSGDGQRLASASYDKSVRVWDLAERPRVALVGHQGAVDDVVFSPDGQRLVTGGRDNLVKLWTREGEFLGDLRGHEGFVEGVSFSPDGEFIATASRDRTIKIWTKTGELLETFTGHEDWVTDVQWHPEFPLLATAGRDRTVKLWTPQGTVLQTLAGYNARVNTVAFSPDGRFLAAGSDDSTIQLWQIDPHSYKASTVLSNLAGHRSWVMDVQFFPHWNLRGRNGEKPLLASASYDNTIKFWTQQGQVVKTLIGHTDSINHLRFDPTGEIMATSTWDNRLQIWQTNDQLLKTWEAHRERVTAIAWSPDGLILVTAGGDSTVYLWSLDLQVLLEQGCLWLRDYLRHNPNVRDGDRNLC